MDVGERGSGKSAYGSRSSDMVQAEKVAEASPTGAGWRGEYCATDGTAGRLTSAFIKRSSENAMHQKQFPARLSANSIL